MAHVYVLEIINDWDVSNLMGLFKEESCAVKKAEEFMAGKPFKKVDNSNFLHIWNGLSDHIEITKQEVK